MYSSYIRMQQNATHMSVNIIQVTAQQVPDLVYSTYSKYKFIVCTALLTL